VGDPLLLCALPRKILMSILISWGMVPVLLAIALSESDCEVGLHLQWYAIPAIAVALIAAVERSCMKGVLETTRFLAEHHSEARGKWVPNMFERVLNVCRPAWAVSYAVVDHWIFLMAFGAMSVMDLATDAIQVGQIRDCELRDREFHSRHMATFAEVGLEEVTNVVYLSGSFGLLLGGAALLQCGVGLLAAVHAVVLSRPGGEAAGNFPDIGVRVDRARRKLSAKLLLIKKLARAAEAASMFHASRVLMELALELEGTMAATASPADLPTKRLPFLPWKLISRVPDASQQSPDCTPRSTSPPKGIKLAKERKRAAEQHRRFKFSLFSTMRLVLFESVPSLVLTVAFFCIQVEKLGALGKAKTVLSTCISSVISISMGLYCYSCGLKGKITAALVAVFSVLPLVKMSFAFMCDSHIFSFFTFQCVEFQSSGGQS